MKAQEKFKIINFLALQIRNCIWVSPEKTRKMAELYAEDVGDQYDDDLEKAIRLSLEDVQSRNISLDTAIDGKQHQRSIVRTKILRMTGY